MIQLEVGELLFEFTSYKQWVNNAKRYFRLHAVTGADTVCVDKVGRLCPTGKQFIRADAEGTFPIRVYRALV